MSAAKFERSPRLKKLYGVLEDLRWHSTLEIARQVSSVSTATDISELRHNGFDLDSRVRETTDEGRTVWEYRLKSLVRLAPNGLELF